MVVKRKSFKKRKSSFKKRKSSFKKRKSNIKRRRNVMHGGAKYVDLFDLTFEEKKKDSGILLEIEKMIDIIQYNVLDILK
jgi:hypothetical protein